VKNKHNARILHDICPKVNKIPEFYIIFVRKMPEFYIIIALFFGGGRAPPAAPPSPTPMAVEVWFLQRML